MDDYKEGYPTYEIAARATRGRGTIYKCAKTGPYKITTRHPPEPYNRAKERAKLQRNENGQ